MKTLVHFLIFIPNRYENTVVAGGFYTFAPVMPRPRVAAASSRVPAVLVRAGLGLSQQQLADWLGVTVGFVGGLEAGRKELPAARAARLLVLVQRLPPPDHPAPPLPAAPAPVPLAYAPAGPSAAAAALAAAADPLGAPAPGPLRTAARTARLAALAAERALLRAHARALALAQRRRGLAALLAAAPPPDPAEAARWAPWLASLAAGLAAADPRPAQAAAQRHALAVRAAARHAEADALLALAG